MPQKTRNELKELFKTGAKPSGDDFKAFIDSTLNVSDDGIAKVAGAGTPLKINAQGTDEKLLDFYTGETKTWSINQKPADDKSGLNIATPGGSKLFIDSSSGNIGVGTTSPGAKLEINGDLKLQSGATVNEFSTDGTLAGNSDLAIPTEKAVKTYADTKAPRAGSSSQDFAANNLAATAKITSPMWKVTEVLHEEAGPLPVQGSFTSSGGTLLIWFSGYIRFSGGSMPVRISIKIDNTLVGSFLNHTNTTIFSPFPSRTKVVTGIAAGIHSLQLNLVNPTHGLSSTTDCYYYATVLELPF